MSAQPAAYETTILVVEDDPVARMASSAVLMHAGYHVEEASTGREALAVLAQSPKCSLIILDLDMPELDGWGFIRRIAADEDLRRIPVVVVTGVAADVSSPVWLQKPVDPHVLLSTVACELERVRRPRAGASENRHESAMPNEANRDGSSL